MGVVTMSVEQVVDLSAEEAILDCLMDASGTFDLDEALSVLVGVIAGVVALAPDPYAVADDICQQLPGFVARCVVARGRVQ